jgi:cyanophycin synthetase
VIADYGHNVSSLRAMVETIEKFPHERRIAVYTSAGDRRDCDMVRQGEMLAATFDKIFLYEDQYVRGRKEGEIIGLIRQGISAGGRVREVHDVKGVFPAIERALDSAAEGDLVLVQCDTVDESVAFIKSYMARKRAGREIQIDEVIGAAVTKVRLPSGVGNGTHAEELPSLSAGAMSAVAAMSTVDDLAAVQVVD